MKKTLYILRHAKAETGDSGQDDRDRALVARGINACEVVGQAMARRGIHPDKILCSPSMRTRQTLALVQKTWPDKPPVEFIDTLYMASINDILNVLAGVREETSSLLVIGHNPGLHQLALKLAHGGDEKAIEWLSLKFPTCALAAISLDDHWQHIRQSKGKLEMFTTPKMLGGSDSD